MAKTCTKCNTQVDETDEFCRRCGQKLMEKAKYCRSCGVEIVKGDKFCRSCGATLEYAEEAMKVRGRKNRGVAFVLNFFLPGAGFIYLWRPIFILIGAVLILSGLVDALLYWHGPYMVESYAEVIAMVIFGIAWGIAGLVSADYVNKQE